MTWWATARSRSSTTSSTSTSGTCSTCTWSADQALLSWPLRGLARSHRHGTGFEPCVVPAGAAREEVRTGNR
ncbi:hypothetical protein C4Q27_10540 [Pseudomonas sp. SWI36]|nr:hypothetical protein C4Q27_10540 [Pseudomonas sp. SWI36]